MQTDDQSDQVKRSGDVTIVGTDFISQVHVFESLLGIRHSFIEIDVLNQGHGSRGEGQTHDGQLNDPPGRDDDPAQAEFGSADAK